jgi:hypothetical protein
VTSKVSTPSQPSVPKRPPRNGGSNVEGFLYSMFSKRGIFTKWQIHVTLMSRDTATHS